MFLKKLKLKLPYDSATLGNISGKKTWSKKIHACNIHCSNVYNSYNMEAT